MVLRLAVRPMIVKGIDGFASIHKQPEWNVDALGTITKCTISSASRAYP